MKKINILAIVPSLMPTVNLGIILPFKELEKKGIIKLNVILPHMFKKNRLKNIDIVVFCRNSDFSEQLILQEIIKKNIKYIYEIDDNFFRIPTTTLLGQYHRDPLKIITLKKFIANASLVRVYSDILKEDTSQYSDKVDKINTYFSMDLISNQKIQKHSKIRIIYATSRMVDEQQKIFETALKRIATEYKDKVEVYFWGAKYADKELGKLKNVKYLPPIYNYEKFIRKFNEMNFDIGLAPIFDGKFFNSKTNNKYREYGACEIAGIYSNEPLYSSCIENFENGILTENDTDGWYNALNELVNNDKLRNKIKQNAKKDISENYSFLKYCEQWENHVKAVYNNDIVYDKKFLLNKKDTYSFGVINDVERSELLKTFISNIYRMYTGTSIQLNIPMNVNSYTMEDYDYRTLFQYHKNILLVTDNICFINFIIDTYLTNKHKLYIVCDNENISKYANDDIIIFNLDNRNDISLSKLTFEGNSYEEFYYILEKSTPILDKKIKNKFIDKLKKLYNKFYFIQNFVRKINNVYARVNSLRLRAYTYWKIFKINNF